MTLENLVRINQLKQEVPDKAEFEGLLKAALDRLNDAQNSALTFASRFDLAYNAAHGLALAALRAAGYRSGKRYMVFQCLVHTLRWTQQRFACSQPATIDVTLLSTKVIWKQTNSC